MTHRIAIRCNSCSQPLTLRVGVAGGHQPFVFACPRCGAPLHATFIARLDPMELRLESDDVEQVAAEEADALAVAVSTELPVHVSLVGATGDQAHESTFLYVSQALGLQRAAPVIEKAHQLRALREQLFPGLRRAARAWSDRDLHGVVAALRAIPGSDRLDWANDSPTVLLDQLVGLMYSPLEQPGVRESSAKELLKLTSAAVEDHLPALTALTADLDSGPLEEHRQRVVEAMFAALGDVDAFFPALWAEAMEGFVDLAPYRVMRDDFARRKSSFQDLFELTSRTLAFTAPIANLVLRGDATAYRDGKTRTLHKALEARAFDRAAWLADFPLAERSYAAVSRHTRNDIGHALLHQDIRRGLLIYGDGTEQNYILFLVDWLQAVRLVRYALDVIMILDRMRSAVRLRGGSVADEQ